jgi:hypothetical protein
MKKYHYKPAVKIDSISLPYGFEIGKRMIEVKAISEKHALIQIVNKYWDLIDDAGQIKLLGEGVKLTDKK